MRYAVAGTLVERASSGLFLSVQTLVTTVNTHEGIADPKQAAEDAFTELVKKTHPDEEFMSVTSVLVIGETCTE